MPLRRAGKKKMRAPLLGSAKFIYYIYTYIYTLVVVIFFVPKIIQPFSSIPFEWPLFS